MKKFLSFLLALLMVLTLVLTMVACQEAEPDDPANDNKPGDTTDPGNKPEDQPTDKPGDDKEDDEDDEDDVTVPDPDERIPLDYLPEKNFGGTSFHILEWSCNDVVEVGMSWIPWEEGDVEVEDGDMLASAVFERNAWAEETYGVDITKEYASIDGNPGYITLARNDASVDSNLYQLFTMRTIEIIHMIREELFADMNEYEQFVRVDKPWWVEDSVESFTLGSHLYAASSEMLLRDKGATAALYFNQTMVEDYTELPNFFELAANQEWTLAEMLDACEIVAHSNDSDTELNSAEDVWGWVGDDDPVYFLYNAAGYKFAHVDEDGFIDYDFAEEDSDSIIVMQDIFEDVIYADWYMHEGLIGKKILEKEQDLFVDGNALFKSGMIKDTTNKLKNMENLYGILPHPKFSLDQENYSSLVYQHHDSAVGIPSHTLDKEMSAIVLEALSWESYYSVYPVFYETILLNRAAKDQESKEMLKLIFSTRSYDPGQYWDSTSGLHGGSGLLRLSETGSSDIASIWAKHESKVQESIDRVNNWIADKEAD